MFGAPQGGSLFPRELKGCSPAGRASQSRPCTAEHSPGLARAHWHCPRPSPLEPLAASVVEDSGTCRTASPHLRFRHHPHGLSSTLAPWWLRFPCPSPVTFSGPALALSLIPTLWVSSSAETVIRMETPSFCPSVTSVPPAAVSPGDWVLSFLLQGPSDTGCLRLPGF